MFLIHDRPANLNNFLTRCLNNVHRSMRFRSAVLVGFVFTQFFFKFQKNGFSQKLNCADLPHCERMISVDSKLNTQKPSKFPYSNY